MELMFPNVMHFNSIICQMHVIIMLSKINLHLLDLELFLYFEKHFENPVIS